MMLDCASFYEDLLSNGFRFFTGVPDSLLKDFCAYVSDHTQESDHVISANEGNAIALAMGHYLGCGEPGLVYMQNSGIGNAVNPLLSLADPDVYSVPMLMLIGWRGEPGVKDEPQHVKQGRCMTELMESIGIPWFLLPGDPAEASKVLVHAAKKMHELSGPVALLVKKGTFDRYKLQSEKMTDFPMNREDAVIAILDQLAPSDVVVSTTGKASREVYEYRQARGMDSSDFLTVGGMGHTSSIAMGLARTQPDRRVFCLDGDGSVIMHMGAMGVIGQQGPQNLIHVVLNNGSHDSVGGQPTVGHDIDIPAIASACGYRQVMSTTEKAELAPAISRLREIEGPSMLEVRINKGARADLGRPKSTPVENRNSLMTSLGL